MKRLLPLLEFLIPEGAIEGGPEAVSRARSTAAASLLLMVQCIIGGAFNFAVGQMVFVKTSLLGVVLLPLTLLVLRATRRPGPAATWLGLSGAALVLTGMFNDSGLESPTVMFLLLLPIVVYTLGGPRHGVLSAVLLALGLTGMWAFEDALAPFIRPGQVESRHWFVVQDFIFTSSILLIILWMRERSVLEAHRRAEEETRARLTAEAESSAKSQVLASMSHEIRTPLNGILGSVELMTSIPLPSEARAHVSAIVGSGDLLHNILNDILDSAKADAGLIELLVEPVSPAELSSDVVQLLGASAHKKGLRLEVELDPSLPPGLEADRQRLKQILLNLVGNAIKFTDEGGITLRQRFAEGRWVLEVQDTGIGIDPKAQERIFQPFAQASADTSHNYGGTGLGLSISRHLAELMGGALTLASEPGQGATFTLSIPSRPVAPPRRLADTLDQPVDSLRILVVEDNEVNQRVIQAILERDGHEVQVAEDGLVAVEACREASFDLVLMDLNMPRMGGLEATRVLREEHADAFPIVGLSASAMDSDRQKALAAGMDDFLAKPVRLPRLRALLARYANPSPELKAAP